MKDIKIYKDDLQNKTIRARELYLKLGLDKSNWSRWYKGNILNNITFKEGEHWSKNKVNVNGNKVLDFYISKDLALYIINSAKTVESKNKHSVIKEYNIEDTVEVVSKPEIEFGIMLKRFLKKWGISIEPQFTILNYRIDFLINGFIAVEYDEEHHELQIEKDNKRMVEINNYINEKFEGCHSIEWIRVKKGNEIGGLSEIVEKLIECESLDCWDGKLRVTNFNSDSFGYKDKEKHIA